MFGLSLLSLPLWLLTPTFRRDFLKVPLVVWCFGFAWVTMLWFLGSSQSETAWRDVLLRLSAIMLILSCLMIFASPSAVRSARWTLVFSVLLGVTLNIYDFFVPMTFSEFQGRAAGLYMNPNISGEALVLGMILSVTVLPSSCRGPFLLLTGVGIFLTFSRGGILAWLIAVSGLLLFTKAVRAKDLISTFLLTLFVVFIVLLPRLNAILTTMDQGGAVSKDTETRLEWLTNPFGVSENSGSSRKYVAEQAWRKFSDHPWVGSGTGTMHESFDIPPHNQYLSYMLDHGVLGAAIVPLLILTLIWGAQGETGRVGLVFGATTLWLCFWTHTMLYYGYSLILFALLAAMVLTESFLVRDATKATTAGKAALDKTLWGA
ncbi:MAG TPA: O-antigen ligase family protein [Nitrospiraceae bacterium]|nr:O-antigen ligase family protein [Nitrospiraceae bacterium]